MRFSVGLVMTDGSQKVDSVSRNVSFALKRAFAWRYVRLANQRRHAVVSGVNRFNRRNRMDIPVLTVEMLTIPVAVAIVRRVRRGI